MKNEESTRKDAAVFLPHFYMDAPLVLSAAQAPFTSWELEADLEIRRCYLAPGEPAPDVNDWMRFRRLLKGCSVYVEAGTQDKGNMAAFLGKLAPNAIIIDIDVNQAASDKQAKLIEVSKGPKQRYFRVEADKTDNGLVIEISAALNVKKAYIRFCDTEYVPSRTLREFSLYYNLLKRNGFLAFHDCYFERIAEQKGRGLGSSGHRQVYACLGDSCG